MARYDPGLQPERTELAWRRTALAVAVGSLVSMRVAPLMLGSPAWALVGVVGLLAAAALWLAARARYHAAYRALEPGADGHLPDGHLLTWWAACCSGLGLAALIAVLVTA